MSTLAQAGLVRGALWVRDLRAEERGVVLKDWVAYPDPRPDAALRLFCFPHAGAGAAIFAGWPSLLPRTIDVAAVRLPGRETRLREAPYRRLDLLVDALEAALRPHLDRPFAFFGHSLGALVAFELVRRLRHRGGPLPSHLHVAGRRAPQLPDREPPVSALDDAAFVTELQRRYDGIPRAILDDVELLRLFLPMLRADCELLEGYVYRSEAPLPTPISAYGGRADERARGEDLAAWSVQTIGPFAMDVFAGGHFFLHDAQAELAAAVERELLRSHARAAEPVLADAG